MKRRVISLWVFVIIFTLGFSSNFEDICSLSKDPNEIERSVVDLLNYVKANRGFKTKSEYLNARKIFAKYRIYKLYHEDEEYSDLVETIIREDERGFLKLLIMRDKKLPDPFRYVFFIFDFGVEIEKMYDSIMKNDLENFTVKFKILRHIWKIPDFSSYLSFSNTDRIVQVVVDLSLVNPTLFETDTERFLSELMDQENVKFFGLLLESKIENLKETEYPLIFKILNFYMDMTKKFNLKPNPNILAFYTDLNFYLSLDRSISTFNVDFSIPQLLIKKLQDMLNYMETFESLRIRKELLRKKIFSLLEQIYLGIQFKNLEVDPVDLDLLRKSIGSIKDVELVSRMALILSTLKENTKSTSKSIGKKGFSGDLSPWLIPIIPISFFIGILILPGRIRVVVLWSLGFKRMAIFFFKRIVAKNPSSPMLHAELGMMYEKIGLEEQARVEYKIAMKLVENRERKRKSI